MKRAASRTIGELRVQLPAGQPPSVPSWARQSAGAGAAPKAKAARRRAPAVGFRMMRVTLAAIAGAQAVIALAENSAPRVFLSIRCASTSAGSLLVSFGAPPASVEACDFELVPGAVLMLDGNSGVPQDDVWVLSTAGAVGSIAYGLKG